MYRCLSGKSWNILEITHVPSCNIVFARGWMTLEKVRDRGHFCNLYFVCVCVCVCGCAGSSLLWGLFSLVVTSRGYSLDVAGGLLIGAASLAAGHGLQGMRASVVLVCGLKKFGSWAPEHRSSSRGSGP